MIIDCPNCLKRYMLDDSLLPTEGKKVRCSSCHHIWKQSTSYSASHILLEKTPKALSKNRTREMRWILLLTGFPLALLALFSVEKLINIKKTESVSFSLELPRPKQIDVRASFTPLVPKENPLTALQEKDLWQDMPPLDNFTPTTEQAPEAQKQDTLSH